MSVLLKSCSSFAINSQRDIYDWKLTFRSAEIEFRAEMLLVGCRQLVQEKEELVWSWERQRNWCASDEYSCCLSGHHPLSSFI
jgi:hypothetical protein